MNINTLRYSLFGIAGDQEVDHTFVKLHFISEFITNLHYFEGTKI